MWSIYRVGALVVARDIAGVGDERDAASRAPPRGTGRWAPAARAREAPDGRGEGAGRCRQARRQSPDRLDRNLLSWAANESQGMGEEEGARARDGLPRQTPTSGMGTSSSRRRALRANHPRQN